MSYKLKILFILLFIVTIFIYGIVGYEVIEGWNFLDSAYMVVITLASVGYREVHPLSSGGTIFTISLILLGMGVLVYGLTTITEFVIEGDLREILRRRKMLGIIKKMKDHYIVCGLGKTGKNVVSELIETKRQFVVIDYDPEKAKELGKDVVLIQGDSTHDTTLVEAGILEARGLVAVLPEDVDNLFLVLTARNLNPDLRIVAKCIEEETIPKLFKAGANSVVSPKIIGGLRLASELIRPAAVSFLDMMLRVQKRALRIEEAKVWQSSIYVGKKMEDLQKVTGKESNLLIIALLRNQEHLFNPPPETEIKAGDVVIVMGDVEDANRFRQLLK
ncbi:potassium channel protein [candidate division WOR-3 bacterium]|nr:potassium channel protein [candidate division WOR-3 bacterium]MCK4527203.1 potassium channel protein [candidate division WOR-3 bacterium]